MKSLAARGLLVLVSCFVVGLCSSQGATLIGVVGTGGGFIPGASVSVYSGRHEWRAETNGRGAFQFELPAGVYDVEVAAFGFRKRIFKTVEMGLTDRYLHVNLEVLSTGSDCSGVHITYLNPGRSSEIRGVVSDSRSSGLQGVTISISTERDPAAGFMHRRTVAVKCTMSNGEFSIPNLKPGLYRLEASRKGYVNLVLADLRVRPGEAAKVDFPMFRTPPVCS